MTKPYNDYVGIYLQEQGNKYVFFVREDHLFINANGQIMKLEPHATDSDLFEYAAQKVKVKFNRTSQGFCHFVDFYFADRHNIAVRKFDNRSSLERLLTFDKRDVILILIGVLITYSLLHLPEVVKFLNHK